MLLLCGLADNLNRGRRPICPLLAEKSLTTNRSTPRQQGPLTPTLPHAGLEATQLVQDPRLSVTPITHHP